MEQIRFKSVWHSKRCSGWRRILLINVETGGACYCRTRLGSCLACSVTMTAKQDQYIWSRNHLAHVVLCRSCAFFKHLKATLDWSWLAEKWLLLSTACTLCTLCCVCYTVCILCAVCAVCLCCVCCVCSVHTECAVCTVYTLCGACTLCTLCTVETNVK